ncbi:hypothetical protein GALMADRAFT_574824 [Galerina marginata CBS 339.88]|uniref:Uncharacterized protein n=1 Tax=Galerina marginata (strain CBS 339.88) TaxID=685588 RepID=A0A067SW39_GALM3|nr:hypothetical protein GALMADRAFT_574824 [Galerina marginata CBS 339.88]
MAATGSSKKKLSTTLASNKVADDFQVVERVQNRPAGVSFQASSNARTTARAARRNISRTEPCFITKQSSYALEIAHWVNPVRKDLSHQQMIEEFLKRLGIVRHDFNLNDPSNLTNLDPTLHVCLDKFGFFAVTASLETLKKLITLVEAENRTWQNRFDDGMMYTRGFYLSRPPIVDAEYELVVLHPEIFLPKGSGLTVFSQTNGQLSGKIYVVGHDRTLRESPGTSVSPRLPAFSFDANRFGSLPLNERVYSSSF